VERERNERYEQDAHSSSNANAHVVLWFVCLTVCWLVASLVEPSQEKEERFVNEAIGTTDAGWNSVANHPTELGTERVREEVEVGEAQATSVELQWEEVEVLSKQMRPKRWAKPRH
jgi:hypothetical protein